MKILPTQEQREVAIFGGVRMRTTPEFFIRNFKQIVQFKKHQAVLQIGKFSDPPQEADVMSLSLDPKDVKAIKECKIGKCEIKLSADTIREFRNLNWKAPNVPMRVHELARTMVVHYAINYMREGNQALSVYHDQKNPLRLADEFRDILKASPYLYHYFPELHLYLDEFPSSELPNSEGFLYWSKEKFGLKPVISITHVTIYWPASSWSYAVIPSKQIYASHYFDASLGLTFVVGSNKVPIVYVMYLNRSRSDALRGGFSGLKRAIVESKMLQGMEENIKATKQRLESLYKEERKANK